MQDDASGQRDPCKKCNKVWSQAWNCKRRAVSEPQKSKAASLSAGSPRKPAAWAVLTSRLRLNDARSNEENKLLVFRVYGTVLEQVAQVRYVAKQRYLLDAQRVLSLDHAANHDRAAIGYQHLGGSLLGDEFWVAICICHAKVRQGVFHIHIEEDGAFRRDLRSHRQPQESVHIGGRRRST